PDRLKLEAARSIREDYLHQDAFHEVDTYTSVEKQFKMMELILSFYDLSLEGLNKGISIEELVKLPIRERIGRFKYVTVEKIEAEYNDILKNLQQEINNLLQKEES
ncbi:MAG: atpA, partial [Anaerocolumna sp.]|nr:atpA [Anaerocolumna sp.]